MKQLTEDFVSYETAKLLKEKKFGWKCNTVYLEFEDGRVELRYEDKALYQEQTKVRYCVPALLAPSLYNIMKWLREVHNIFIEINVSVDLNGSYHFNYSILDKECKYIKRFVGYYSTHELCVEAALLYTLKNLI